YHLFTPRAGTHPRAIPFTDPEKFQVHTPSGGRLLWRSVGIKQDLKNTGIELFHGLSHELPVGLYRTGIRSVVTIHDLIFLHYPTQYKWWDRQVYRAKFRYACTHADSIIAISESTKSDIVSAYGISPEKISVIYQACDPIFQQALTPEARSHTLAPYDLPREYLLYVGSLIERKGLHQIVKALRMLPASLDIPLIVVGKGKAYRKQVEAQVRRYGLQDRVRFLMEIPFDAFPALYQQASALVFPSMYEGFGIPVIEALWSRTPVITSDRSSLPEAGGPDSWYVDPEDAQSIAAAIMEVLENTEARARRVAAGHAYVQRFDGQQLANQVMAVYREVMRG
ncbi:MAG: glycosyltransferase family 4 protein, partial [Saprospiraceae bacterium]|nr:glycosyltransferase family 4 protein [Saprospiraceae bacterium]